MTRNNKISIITVPDKDVGENKHDPGEGIPEKPADFETAIAVAGHGKFQYLLLLAIIPASWGTSLDTSNVSMILPSAECDLQMTFFQKGVLNAINFAGMALSGFLWGYVADARGRRSVFMYGYMADGVCNILSGFSQDFWTLATFKLLSGFIVSGPHASIVTYFSEFYGVKGRLKIPIIFGMSVTCGNIVSAVLAWLVIPQQWSIVLWDGAFVYNSWRIFLSLCGVPIVIGSFLLCLFPESPKFLMSQGRTEEALKVFKRIYRVNTGRPGEEYPISRLEDESYRKVTNNTGQEEKSQRTAIFFYPHLSRLVLVVIIQFGSMLATNTIRLWQPQLFTIMDNFESQNLTMEHDPSFCEILDLSMDTRYNANDDDAVCVNATVSESIYTNTVIIASFGSLCLLTASFLTRVLNHRNLLYICYGVALACIVYLNWSTDTSTTLVLTCLFVGLMNTTLNTLVAVAVILFPTSLRTTAVSLVMMSGRLGSIVGNIQFPVLLSYGCLAPMITLAVFITICIVLTRFLPYGRKTAT
ncbi:synaptic vesicle glycoprotein 2C [Ptiloglossa arizonensis]|uniref:synaptic vesicle glycoprotein 2C n=1 Tax=Ptiloglossa arizonensis TaxID=3350558 RepID=UPI003FA193ED